MARKNNIRSMRFSDDVIEMIESQAGRNFSEKFENFVTRCMLELPEKEKRIEELDKQIDVKRSELRKLATGYMEVWRDLGKIRENVSLIRQTLDRKSIKNL